MSKALIEKIRRARELKVPVNGKNYTIRRPTDAEAVEMPSTRAFDFVCAFVVGWDLVELDLIPGGGPEAVPFDADLWREWVADHPDLWQPLAMAMKDAYIAHVKERGEDEKNS